MSSKFIKSISLLFGVTFIFLLIISAPAQAFIINLAIQNQYIELGKSTTFNVSTEVESNEKLNINKFIIEINGPTDITCEFLPDGTLLNDCEGISISVVSSGNLIKNDNQTYGDTPAQISGYYSDYCGEYGYGCAGYGGYNSGYSYYGKGILSYNVTFNSMGYSRGMYNTEFKMVVDGKEYKKDGKALFIYDRDGLRGCSVRAQRGDIEIKDSVGNNYNGTRNRLSFNIPLKNAVAGQGTLISQNSDSRLNYDFDVLGVLEGNKNYSKILIKGIYRTNNKINKTSSELAVIYLDKKNKVLTLAGKSITATEMKVSFMDKC
ncbi:MAG TPA: hypothetical protein P5277_02370 [Candidatus Paceibacterota bacterium]|nr:hypothetical protein [Candidatus Paceibacterota bacterium]